MDRFCERGRQPSTTLDSRCLVDQGKGGIGIYLSPELLLGDLGGVQNLLAGLDLGGLIIHPPLAIGRSIRVIREPRRWAPGHNTCCGGCDE